MLITLRLVKPMDPDEVPDLPTDSKQFMPDADAIGAALQGGTGAMDAPAGQRGAGRR